MAIKNQKLIEMYRIMARIRRFEERAVQENLAGKIPRHVHSGIGQEAIPTGAILALRKEDLMLSGHRGQGYLIAKGRKPTG